MQTLSDPMQAILTKLQNKSKSFREQQTSVQTSKHYECEDCNDVGGFLVTKRAGDLSYYREFDGTLKEEVLKADREVWQECKCREIKRTFKLIKSSAITADFQKLGFGNFEENVDSQVLKMKKLAEKYYANFNEIKNTRKNSFIAIGQSGCGKTHIVCAISNNLMQKKKIPVLYFPFIDGMNNISNNNYERKNEITQKMKDIDVLLIDDLYKPIKGEPTAHSWMVNIIYEVINHRYLNHLPVLISSELTLEVLIDIDEATGSRIFEMGQDYCSQVGKSPRNNWRLRKLQGDE